MALFPTAKPKAHSLTGRITQPLLHAAFKAVQRNRGAAGIDKVSINMFENNLAENLAALERDLKDGSFNPFPLRRKWIPKEPGKFRPLGIPAVRDRVAQEALRRLLHPIFEPLFHDASFGFRPGRNCHQALERVLKLHAEGYRVVLFRKLDCWIRRRVRCMKFKRFGYHDNRRWRVKQAEQLGLLRLESFCWS